MIKRIEGTKYGYQIDGGTTDGEFKRILRNYPSVRCIIVNKNMYKYFQTPVLGKNIITVNNKVNNFFIY